MCYPFLRRVEVLSSPQFEEGRGPIKSYQVHDNLLEILRHINLDETAPKDRVSWSRWDRIF